MRPADVSMKESRMAIQGPRPGMVRGEIPRQGTLWPRHETPGRFSAGAAMTVPLGEPTLCARCGEPYTFRGAYRLREPMPGPLPAPLRFESEDGGYSMCPKCAREGARWFVKEVR